jgi:hypothetical protein
MSSCRNTWGVSGEFTTFIPSLKSRIILRRLVIAARLERATYCLEGRFRLFLACFPTSTKSTNCTIFPVKLRNRTSSWFSIFTVIYRGTWGVSGELARLCVFTFGEDAFPWVRTLNFDHNKTSTLTASLGGKDYGKQVYGYGQVG